MLRHPVWSRWQPHLSRRLPLATRLAVTARRTLARHRWIHRGAVVLVALAAAATTLDRMDAVDEARDAWGTTRSVLVTTHGVAPGEPLSAEPRSLPEALLPPTAVPAHSTADALVAHHQLSPGEVVTEADVRPAGPLALVPPGWVAVAVVESPASGAQPGERVVVVSEGVIVVAEALVIDHTDDATLVAVPEREGPLVPLAASAGTLALLRVP